MCYPCTYVVYIISLTFKLFDLFSVLLNSNNCFEVYYMQRRHGHVFGCKMDNLFNCCTCLVLGAQNVPNSQTTG